MSDKGVSDAYELQRSRTRRIEAEIIERNQDLLIAMWRVAVEDPAACMLMCHAPDSLVQYLRTLTLNQLKRAGAVNELLFTPRFDLHKLKRLTELNEAATPASPEAIAMVYATLSTEGPE